MGILLMNIVGFAMPELAYINPMAWGGTRAIDLTAWTISQLLFDGRMRGLFALLFGASALLVMMLAEAGGKSPRAVHLRRMVTLALFGAAHLFLIWNGDILLHYALIGSVLLLARDWPPNMLAGVGVTALVVHALFWSLTMGGVLALQAAAGAPGASPDLVEESRRVIASFPAPGYSGIFEELEVYRGGYAGILAERWGDGMGAVTGLLTVNGGETLGYMLIGMALLKSGFFTGGWSRRALLRLMLLSYAISLPVLALLTWWAFASGFHPVVLLGNFLGWSVPFRVLCALGHLALAMLLLQGARGWLVERINAAGRMAFTNYLATSAIMTTIFYGYGLGLFGHVGRAELYLFVLGMWVLMLTWSKPWLDRFLYGPLEWLWRSLARLSPQPMLYQPRP